MKAIICDKCKEVFKPKEIKLIRINKMTDITSYYGSETESFEICGKCYTDMFKELRRK